MIQRLVDINNFLTSHDLEFTGHQAIKYYNNKNSDNSIHLFKLLLHKYIYHIYDLLYHYNTI